MAFNYFPAGYQPAQIVYPTQPNATPTQASVSPTQSALTWVQGEAGAKSYLVAPNSTVVLWDSESPTIYIKSSDASGLPTMRVFDYTERTATPKAEAQMDFAPISDFENLKNDVEEIKKYLKSEKETEKAKEKSK
jgi:hypothetical protein